VRSVECFSLIFIGARSGSEYYGGTQFIVSFLVYFSINTLKRLQGEGAGGREKWKQLTLVLLT